MYGSVRGVPGNRYPYRDTIKHKENFNSLGKATPKVSFKKIIPQTTANGLENFGERCQGNAGWACSGAGE
ncbi:MAG: hypothetical protein D3922_13735 [Candidatus Electrothrix sp. AR1]|nr:hypothetical protein [Candidatus Electrothrix sp. AR1]